MRTIKTTCDECGAEIAVGESHWSITKRKSVVSKDGTTERGEGKEIKVLCNGCGNGYGEKESMWAKEKA